MLALQDLLGEAIRRHVFVAAQPGELRAHAAAGLPAEDVGEAYGALSPSEERSRSSIRWARAQVAAIANSSAPTSTSRNSTDWRCSSLGPKRTIEWKTPRASRRALRSTKRTWPASRPNSA